MKKITLYIYSVWKEYQKLSLRLRRATARPEAAFFILDAEKVPGPKSIIQDFLYNRKSKRKSSDSIDLSLELKLDSKSISSSFDESILSVGSLPNPDHSLIISSIPHKVT